MRATGINPLDCERLEPELHATFWDILFRPMNFGIPIEKDEFIPEEHREKV